jgi:hypothetical protein
VFDTWAKIESGFLTAFGVRPSFGHFDACLKFRHEVSSSDVIQGQHCFVAFGAAAESTLPDEIEGDFDWREM